MKTVTFYTNFESALSKLHEFATEKIENDRDRAGLIQGFEFTFEQCWKAIQKKAKDEGLSPGSPRQAFSVALSWNWIDSSQESLWLDMIESRNLTTHTYREAVALEICEHILDRFLPAFQKLLKKMQSI